MLSDRPVVTVGDTVLDGLIDASIETCAARTAARANLTFSTQRLEASALADPSVRLVITDWRTGAPLLICQPDNITIDRIGGTTTVDARDLAGLLIDQTLAETFANRTASDIAAELAQRHALIADVAATTTSAGRLFRSDRALLALNSEWDLLSALADAENCDLQVIGETLIFKPPAGSEPITLRLADCIALQQTSSPAISRGIELTIQSWDAAAARPIAQTATSGKKTRRRHLTQPNLTEDQAAKLAARIVADLARFERTVTLTMPGETAINTRSSVRIEGDTYRVASIHREWGSAGFTQNLELTAP